MAEMDLSVDAYVDHNQVYDYLKHKIITLALPPGTKVSENKVAVELNVGRPLVREGFSRLEEEGYIEVYPQKGTFVSKLSLEKIRQAVEVHAVFEQALAKELAEKKMTREQERLIQEVLYGDAVSDITDDAWQIILIEQQIWYLLAKFCNKEYIWSVYRVSDCHLIRVSYMQYSTYGYRSLSYALTGREYARVEGRMLMDNIVRGDAEAAALVCMNRLNMVMMNTDALHKIYPSYFTE